jgi:ketosteroid isomerase-like protein
MEPAAGASGVVLKGRKMGKIMIAASAVLAIGAAVPAAAHGPAKQTDAASKIEAGAEEPARVVDAFHAALARGETTAALALLADDAVIYESGGVERGKAEYASHHLEADAAFSKAVPSRITRRTGAADGSVAWLLTEGRTTGTFKDRPVDRVTTETAMLRRVGGAWRVTHFHWSSAAAKAAK